MELSSKICPYTTFCEGHDNIEKDYGIFYRYYKKNYGKYITDNKNAKILVTSCGYGLFINFLLKEGYSDILGIDSDINKINYAKTRGFNVMKWDSMEMLATLGNKYDMIVCEMELNHLTKQEIIDFLKKIHSMLEKEGVLIVHSLNGANPAIGPDAASQNFDHYTLFTGKSLTQILKYIGYKSIRVYPIDEYIYYKNPLNYIGRIVSDMYHLFFKFNFRMYGKKDSIFTKKVGAVCRK